jgi:hypothetical protein
MSKKYIESLTMSNPKKDLSKIEPIHRTIYAQGAVDLNEETPYGASLAPAIVLTERKGQSVS